MNKLVSGLFRLARVANDINKIKSGDPKKIIRRLKNKLIGRKIIRKIWWKEVIKIKGSYEFFDLASLIELEERKEKESTKVFRTCPKCGKRKSIYLFSVDKRNTKGRTNICKSCLARKSLQYYYENREELLIKMKEYQDQKDRSKYFQDYQKNHKEHLQKIAHIWYMKNRKRIKKKYLKRKAILK